MKTALILAVVVAAYCLTACGGSDDEDCDTPPAAEQGMDKAPTEPCRAAAQ